MTEVDLNWKFYPKQKQALDAASSGDYDITVFLGGYRSGKSTTGARWLLQEGLRIPGSEWLAMAVDYTKGKHTTYEVLFEELPGDNTNPFKGGDPENSPIVKKYTKHDRSIILISGSVIVLAGADEETRYEGGSFNGAWLDEPGNYRDKLPGVLSTLLERLDAGPPGAVLGTTTGKTGELQEIVERRIWPDTGDEVKNSIEVVRASTTENPFLSEQALQRLKRRYAGTNTEGMALHGEFGDVEGRVYPNFSRDVHVLPEEEILRMVDHTKRFAYGYDAGWDNEMVVLEAAIGPRGEILLTDEFYHSNKFVEDAADWLTDRPKGDMACEHEPAHIQKFKKLTPHRPKKADKSIDAGINAVQHRFQEDGIYISEECVNTIDELLKYRKEDVGGTNVADHACDALRYLVMMIESGDREVKVKRISNPFSA